MAAASIAAAACVDLANPLDPGRSRSELAVLLLQGNAPSAGSIQFVVSNARVTTRTLFYLNPQSTPFLEITFPSGSLATVSGRVATAADSVTVSVAALAGTVGFTLGAPATSFATGNPPTVRLFHGFGDFAASRAGTRYSSAAEYAAALTLWLENPRFPDRFTSVSGSGARGTDAAGGAVEVPSMYFLAALK